MVLLVADGRSPAPQLPWLRIPAVGHPHALSHPQGFDSNAVLRTTPIKLGHSFYQLSRQSLCALPEAAILTVLLLLPLHRRDFRMCKKRKAWQVPTHSHNNVPVSASYGISRLPAIGRIGTNCQYWAYFTHLPCLHTVKKRSHVD